MAGCCSVGAVHALVQGSADVDPVTAAREFRRSFVDTYGECSPAWVESSWQVCGTMMGYTYTLHARESVKSKGEEQSPP